VVPSCHQMSWQTATQNIPAAAVWVTTSAPRPRGLSVRSWDGRPFPSQLIISPCSNVSSWSGKTSADFGLEFTLVVGILIVDLKLCPVEVGKFRRGKATEIMASNPREDDTVMQFMCELIRTSRSSVNFVSVSLLNFGPRLLSPSSGKSHNSEILLGFRSVRCSPDGLPKKVPRLFLPLVHGGLNFHT